MVCYYREGYSQTYKSFYTFHGIKWENLTATENAIPRIVRNLKEFIVNIIKIIKIDVNPIVKKVTLSSSISIINFFTTDFARKLH